MSKQMKKVFFHYLLVFCVPMILLSVILQFNTINYKIDAEKQYNYSLLVQFKNSMDLSFPQIQEISFNMSLNDALLNIRDKQKESDLSNESIHSELSVYKNYLDDHLLLGYYIRGTDKFYFQEEIDSFYQFGNSGFYEEWMDTSELYQKMNQVSSPVMITAPISQSVADSLISSVLLLPVPYLSKYPEQTLCIFFTDEYFKELKKKYFGASDLSLMILDAMGCPIYYDGIFEGHLKEMNYTLKQSSNIPSVKKINGTSYMTMQTISENTGYQYITVTKYRDYFKNIWPSVKILLSTICCLLIFSVIMAILLAKNYIKKIKSAEAIIDKKENLIYQMAISKLINGSICDGDKEALSYTLKCANLNFEYPFFAVAVCCINDLALTEEKLDEISSGCSLKDLKGIHLYVTSMPLSNNIIMILNNDGTMDLSYDILKSLEAYYQKMPYQYSIGCGNNYDSIYELDTSYIEAMVSIEKKMNKIGKSSYLFKETTSSSDDYMSMLSIEQAIIEHSINEGNVRIASASVNKILSCFKEEQKSVIFMNCMRYDLINIIAKVASSLKCALSETEIKQLITCDFQKQFPINLESQIESLAKKAQVLQSENDQLNKHKIIVYVQEHFNENDLSLSKLVDLYNLTSTYLSKVFKEETGQTFLSYLTELRFSYIKNELLKTDKTTKQIITEAGYVDVASFTRKFKQRENMTPGEYRGKMK